MKTTGEDLIDQLEALRIKLNSLREKLENSGVERTHGLREAMGDNCKFFRKSLGLFLEKDYLELRDIIRESCTLFDIIEGEE